MRVGRTSVFVDGTFLSAVDSFSFEEETDHGVVGRQRIETGMKTFTVEIEKSSRYISLFNDCNLDDDTHIEVAQREKSGGWTVVDVWEIFDIYETHSTVEIVANRGDIAHNVEYMGFDVEASESSVVQFVDTEDEYPTTTKESSHGGSEESEMDQSSDGDIEFRAVIQDI